MQLHTIKTMSASPQHCMAASTLKDLVIVCFESKHYQLVDKQAAGNVIVTLMFANKMCRANWAKWHIKSISRPYGL